MVASLRARPDRSSMFVIKRDKTREPVHFDKITKRIQRLCDGLEENVDAVRAVLQIPVCRGACAGHGTAQALRLWVTLVQ